MTREELTQAIHRVSTIISQYENDYGPLTDSMDFHQMIINGLICFYEQNKN